MQRLAERQRDFAEALLNPELPAPAGLVGPNGGPSSKRFAVYRNNVVAGLTETLKDAFPAVRRIVGADFFQAMARAYVVSEPPQTPILLDYGAGFPDFIRLFAPAATLPYLSDVARIERAWTEAYHSPEAAPFDPAAFTAVEPDQLPGIRLLLHPSLRVVRSQFPALTIWQMTGTASRRRSISPPAARMCLSCGLWPTLKSDLSPGVVWSLFERWPAGCRSLPR